MQCPRCQHENPPGQKFCGECGSPSTGVGRARAYEDLTAEIERLRRSLTDAQDQQTATSEILRVISASPTAVQPVFDSIAEAAMRLCGAVSSLVTTFDGKLLHFCAKADINPEYTDALRHIYPAPLTVASPQAAQS